MGFTATASLLAGTVETATVLGAMTEIGTALSVVGAVTGSSDLSKFGAVMGLAGGIGGAINGTLSANPFDQVTSDAASNGSSLSSGFSDAGALDASGAGGTLSDTTNAFGSGTQAASGVEQASQNATLNGGLDSTATGAPKVTGDVSSGAVSGSTNPTVSTNTNPTDTRLANGTQTTPGVKPPDTASTWLDKMTQFIKGNDRFSAAALQLGGSALSGMNQASQFDRQYGLAAQRQGWGNSVGQTGPTSIIQSVKGTA